MYMVRMRKLSLYMRWLLALTIFTLSLDGDDEEEEKELKDEKDNDDDDNDCDCDGGRDDDDDVSLCTPTLLYQVARKILITTAATTSADAQYRVLATTTAFDTSRV